MKAVGYEYYANDYQPLEPTLKHSDMLECDLGVTDLKDMDNLFNRGLILAESMIR